MAAIEAVNFSKERFVQKNWIDRSRTAWKKRKRKDRGSLMVKSGRLKRSIRKLSYTRNSVTIGTDVPYAQIHNDGGTINKTVRVKSHSRKITKRGRSERTGRVLKKRVSNGTTTVKSHTRKMKLTYHERKFLGQSALLLRRIERLTQREIDKILNR
ncbi:phage virion morphogenesis protein [Empedobacter brevis]|uniref:phage virion morphogenesis protein n=1 Tax=Empedobacter brevis TaxID=247 RepID=UPI00289D898F|nr:phage virion morphogenesis protein [Empedobacter brevis]